MKFKTSGTAAKKTMLLAAGLAVLSHPLSAAGSGGAGDNSFTLYGWLPSVDGELKYDLGGDDSASVDAGDILDALNMTFMGTLETRRGRWSLLADLIYLDLGSDRNSSVSFAGGSSIDTEVDLALDGWQVGLYGGYSLYDTGKASLDILAGLRYLSIDTEAELDIDGPLDLNLPSAELSASTDVWDGVVGVRGRASINENWFVPYHADVGAGESDLTWQAMAGVGYAAGWGDVVLVYRHLAWDEGDDGLLQELSFSGPALAFKFRF